MAQDRDPEEEPHRRRRDPDDDDDDDRPRRRSREPGGSGDGGVGYIIPYKNGPALAAYYVGVFGLILCFLPGLSLFSGVTAMVLGFMGMSRASKHAEAHGRAHAITGIILGLVQVLAVCGMGAFVGIAIMSGK